jgi:prepilin-type N-terminal cleavage/methylation domain-containing protein
MMSGAPTRGIRARFPRGFTLIEITLATTLGSIVLLACLGVYGAMQRSDRVLAVRFEQTSDVALVRTVIQRMMGSLAMSDEQRPPSGDEASKRAERGKKEAEDLTKKAGDGKNSDRQSQADDPLRYRPRLLLSPDTSGAVQGVLRRASIAGASGGGPQRLEIVAMRPPIPPTFAGGMSPALAQAAFQHEQAAQRQLAGEPEPSYATPMRMALELRPDRHTRWLDGKIRGGTDTWTLWWRPLPSDPTIPVPMDPTQDMNAIPVADGLASCHWRVFHKSQFKDEFEAVWWQDLPAYLEMELQTSEGVKASWLFEVEWVNIKEATSEEDEDAQGNGDESGAGGPNAGGGRGSGRPGGRSPSASGRGSVRPTGAGPPGSTQRRPPPTNRIKSSPQSGGQGTTQSGGGGGGRR